MVIISNMIKKKKILSDAHLRISVRCSATLSHLSGRKVSTPGFSAETTVEMLDQPQSGSFVGPTVFAADSQRKPYVSPVHPKSGNSWLVCENT